MEVTEGTTLTPENVTEATPAVIETTAARVENPVNVTGANAPDATATNPNPTDDDDSDPIEEAFAARLALELERRASDLEKTVTTRILAQQEATQTAATAAQEANRLRDSFAGSIKTVRDGLAGLDIYDKAGNPVSIGDQLFEQIVAQPFQRHNSTVQEATQRQILNLLGSTAYNALPATVRDDFAAKAASKPLNEWLTLFAETFAPHTGTVKERDKEVEVRIKAAEARGYAKGQKAREAPPRNITESAPSANGSFDLTTISGLASALVKGGITEAEYVTRSRALRG